MDQKSRTIRCIAYNLYAQAVASGYEVTPLGMDCVSSGLKEVFDGQCPFIFNFARDQAFCCVICSREPDKEETAKIQRESKKAPRLEGGRTQVFIVGG